MMRFEKSSAVICTALAILLCFVLSGCVKNEIVIKVNGDGSGNIVVTRIFSKQAVAMYQIQMDEMKKRMANMPAGSHGMDMPDDPFYNEKALKREAGMFGPDVRYVKAQKYDKEGTRGSVALYAFKDINEVFVNIKSLQTEQNMGRNFGGGSSDNEEIPVAQKEDDAYEFKLVKGLQNELKIIVPDYPAPEPAGKEETVSSEATTELNNPAFPAESADNPEMQAMMAAGNPFGFTGKETQGEVMRKMMGGMSISIAVETDGQVTKSTSKLPHKTKPNRFILMDMDMDKLLASPKFNEKMTGAMRGMGGSPLEFFSMWQGVQGMTLETNREVAITFKSDVKKQESPAKSTEQKKQ